MARCVILVYKAIRGHSSWREVKLDVTVMHIKTSYANTPPLRHIVSVVILFICVPYSMRTGRKSQRKATTTQKKKLSKIIGYRLD